MRSFIIYPVGAPGFVDTHDPLLQQLTANGSFMQGHPHYENAWRTTVTPAELREHQQTVAYQATYKVLVDDKANLGIQALVFDLRDNRLLHPEKVPLTLLALAVDFAVNYRPVAILATSGSLLWDTLREVLVETPVQWPVMVGETLTPEILAYLRHHSGS